MSWSVHKPTRRSWRAHCFRPHRRYNAHSFNTSFRHGRQTQSGATAIFITPAFAQAAGAAPTLQDQLMQFLPPLGFVALIMYFMVLRPQQKSTRERADLLKNIRRGDTIITSGGLIGKVTKVVDDAELEVEIAANVRVRVSRPMVTEVRAKGEPVKDAPVKTAS